MLRFRLFSVLGILVVAGCSVTTNATDPGGSPGAGGASAAQTSDCKKGCDKMKFFDCSTADELAACYSDCDSATPQQIEVFTACAENSICDPQCRTSIVPKEKASSGGTGASASSCSTACGKLVECSFIPLGSKDDCVTQCSTKGYQYQIDCVNNNACGDIKTKCGGGTSDGSTGTIDVTPPDTSLDDCLQECDSINFFDCTTVENHQACRTKCSSATKTEREDFTSCSQSSGTTCTKKAGCLDAFLK